VLRFVDPHRVEGVPLDDPAARVRPWLGGLALAPVARDQLLAVARRFDPALTAEAVFGGDLAAFATADGLAELPLEWWTVEDEAGPRYRLWLGRADAGFLFAWEGRSPLGAIVGCTFEGDGALAAALAEAQRPVRDAHPFSELARVIFVEREAP